MKAILCTRYGSADDLELRDLPEPQPGNDEAVVKVAAAALNFFDTLLIAGKYQIKPDFPFSPAAEFAGIVHTVGAGVTGFKPGDRVVYANRTESVKHVILRRGELVLQLDGIAGMIEATKVQRL